MRELSEVLADSVDARARSVAGLTPDAEDLATVVKTVRRRRVVRHTLQALVIVPLVGVLAVGAYLGVGALQSPDVGPAVTPTESVVAPTPSPTTAPEKGDLVTEMGLPPYFEAPAGLLSHTDAGWVAMTYRPQPASFAAGEAEPLSHVLMLAAPEGDLFRTAELPLDLELQIVSWRAGESRARAMWPTPGVDPVRPLMIGWVDVLTGEVTPDAVQFERWANYVGHDAHGAEIWVEDPVYEEDVLSGGSGDSTVWSLSLDGTRRIVAGIGDRGVPRIDPSGARLLAPGAEPSQEFVVVDLASGAARAIPFGISGQTCAVVGWFDSAAVAALCHDPISDEAAAALDRIDWVAQEASLYRVDAMADGGATLLHAFADGEPVPTAWTGINSGDAVVVYTVGDGFPGGCSVGVGAWNGEAPVLLQGPGDHGANVFQITPGHGSVLVTSAETCEAGPQQAEVTSIDRGSGALTQLTPLLMPDRAAGADYWSVTVTSIAPGTGR